MRAASCSVNPGVVGVVGAVGALAIAGCASGEIAPLDGPPGATDARRIDAPANDAAISDAPVTDARTTDAAMPDAMTDAPPPPPGGGLLLSEIVLAPTGGELIELVNTGTTAIDLSTYYVSDAPGYFKLPAGVAMVAADTSDFVAKFPAGATLAPRAVATIALDTVANFGLAYPGVTPTYSIGSGSMMVLTGGSPTLTNAGEPVVLFQWNGASDKVVDVDIMIAGTPAAANVLVAKTPVDGPDADATPTAYAADALTLPAQTAPGSTRSTKRLLPESAATETWTGGNGQGGHDETSEQTNVTWDSAGYTAPTPGMVPASLVP